MAVTLDSLGESVTSESEAHRAAEVYHRLLDAIAALKLNANISVKLTQMGLEQSAEMAESIAGSLTRHASAVGNFVRIDMEESRLTQVTLDVVRRLYACADLRGSIGVVIQAYLYRSQADIEQLMAEGIRVRLCKGAYKEPAEVAFPRKAQVDRNFVLLSKMLLDSPLNHALATHDEAMIGAAKEFAKKKGLRRSGSNSRCCTGCGAICSGNWCARGTGCGCTCRLAASGIRTSCGGWRSGRRMCCSWLGISSVERNKGRSGSRSPGVWGLLRSAFFQKELALHRPQRQGK